MFRTAAALAAAALGLAALPASALAETRKVPSEQYPTIQSAVSTVQSGDVILVSKGTYAENVTISGNPSFTLKGKGNPVIDAGGGTCITVSFDQNITISGFVLSNADEGVRITGSNHISLSKLTVTGAGSQAFRFRNGSSAITVSKCTVAGTGGEGILDEESADLVITKCRFSGTGLAAIALSPNYFTDSSGGSNGAIVSKNKVTGAGANGIHWGGNDVLVSKNKVSGSAGSGIYNDPDVNTGGATVEKNKVTASGDSGIYVSGSSGTVSKNKVKDANENGIDIRGNGGNTVEKNKVSAADVEGIYVVSTGNTLTKNKASKDGDFDLYDENAAGNNTYDKNKFGKIYINPGV